MYCLKAESSSCAPYERKWGAGAGGGSGDAHFFLSGSISRAIEKLSTGAAGAGGAAGLGCAGVSGEQARSGEDSRGPSGRPAHGKGCMAAATPAERDCLLDSSIVGGGLHDKESSSGCFK